MLFKIAWRNVWRHKLRSSVIITAIALGLWVGIFIMGFYFGIFDQRISDVIEKEVSHFQIHHPQYIDEDKDIQYSITNSEALVNKLKGERSVAGVSGRVISMGMVSSPRGSGGVQINGIDPVDEDKVIGLSTRLIEGKYFEGIKRALPIIIGEKLASKLKVKVRSKVVLTSQDLDYEIVAGSFRVVGIYKTNNAMYDETFVFVRKNDLIQLLGEDIKDHEVAVLLTEHDKLDTILTKYKGANPDLLIESWLDLVPEMKYGIDMMDQFLTIFIFIILLALMFGIINTMLMAVLERMREIGMMMAVGMNKKKIFGMIMLETTFLAMIGAPIGLLAGSLTIKYFSIYGIDLSIVGEAMSEIGYASIIYPVLEGKYYIQVIGQVLFITFISALYPAWKALKLNPVNAIRKI